MTSHIQHKPGCMANLSCLVYHPDGVCPGPYGKCTCDEIKEKPVANQQPEASWEEEFHKIWAFYYGELPGVGAINSNACKQAVKGFINQEVQSAYKAGYEMRKTEEALMNDLDTCCLGNGLKK